MNTAAMLKKVTLLKAQKQVTQDSLTLAKKKLSASHLKLTNLQTARVLVQKVAEETQKKIEFQISNLVSLALASVFPDPYEFKMNFVQRRNRTECDLFFSKGGEQCEPLSAAGGGAIDVASFALRIAIWSLRKSRAVFILDEPFKFLSVNLQDKCSTMMKELSDKLGIQIIMVSHLPQIIGSADKIFELENVKGESKLKGD